MKKIKGIFISLLICCFLFGFVSQAEEDERRVLFISSYSYAWDQVRAQMDGIREGLWDFVVLDYEFMDTKRVDTEEAIQLFYERLAYTLSVTEPYDAIILGDDAALKFALQYRDELFEGIPLFFEGVNDEGLALKAAEDPMITGVIERLSVEKNIELGLSIYPQAKRVVAILDDSITGEAERKRFYSYAEQYPRLEFGELNTSQLKPYSIRHELSKLDKDTILIYIVMTEDGDGKTYSSEKSIELITENAKVPVFRMVDGGIGDGIFGGNVVSMYKSGKRAAQMVMDMMRGVPVEDIKLETESPQVYRIDAEVMERYGISKDVLPKDTEFVNEKESFFDRNREAMIPGCILIAVLLVFSVWALVDNRRHRKLMKELEGARKIMESASQHDFLTGIPNRSKFMSDLNLLMEEKKPCTIFMIDIDDFKGINDTLGHTAGDEALVQLASRLKELETQILTPYRFAGDEFILILKSAQQKIVEKTAIQCLQVFEKQVVLAGNKAKICGSIGIASYPKDTENREELIIFADDAMYQVKKNGKNDFAFYQKKE